MSNSYDNTSLFFSSQSILNTQSSLSLPRSFAFSTQHSNIMCYIEHVCHTPCGHWSDRITETGACPKVRSVGDFQLPCSQIVQLGMANDRNPCRRCLKRPKKSQPNMNLQVEFNDAYLDSGPSPKTPVFGILHDFPDRSEASQALRTVKDQNVNSEVLGLESSPFPTHQSCSAKTSINSTKLAGRYVFKPASITATKLGLSQSGRPTVQTEKSTALGELERGLFALSSFSRFGTFEDFARTNLQSRQTPAGWHDFAMN